MNAKRFVKANYQQYLRMLSTEQVSDLTVGECQPYLLTFFQYYFNQAADYMFITLFWRTCLATVPTIQPTVKELYRKLYYNTPVDETNVLIFFELAILLAEQSDDYLRALGKVDYTYVAYELMRVIYKFIISRTLTYDAQRFLYYAARVECVYYHLQLCASLAISQSGYFKLQYASLFGPVYDFSQVFDITVKKLAAEASQKLGLRIEELRILGTFLKSNFKAVLYNEFDFKASIIVALYFYNQMALLIETNALRIAALARTTKSDIDAECLFASMINYSAVAFYRIELAEQSTQLSTYLKTDFGTKFISFFFDNLVISFLQVLYNLSAGAAFLCELEDVITHFLSYNPHFESTRVAFMYVFCQFAILGFSFKNEQFNKGNSYISARLSRFFNRLICVILENGRFADFTYAVLICMGQIGFRQVDLDVENLVKQFIYANLDAHAVEYKLEVELNVFYQLYEGYGVAGIAIYSPSLVRYYERQRQAIDLFNSQNFSFEYYGLPTRCVFVLHIIDYFLLSGRYMDEAISQLFAGLLYSVFSLLAAAGEVGIAALEYYAQKLFYAADPGTREHFVLLITRFRRFAAISEPSGFCADYLMQVCTESETLTPVQQLLVVADMQNVLKSASERVSQCLQNSAQAVSGQMTYYYFIFKVIVLALRYDEREAQQFFENAKYKCITQITQNLDHFKTICEHFLTVELLKKHILQLILSYLEVASVYTQLEPLGIDFVPFFYTVCKIVRCHWREFALSEAHVMQLLYIYKRESIPGLDYKQNRYLQNISQSNQQFVHAATAMSACVLDDYLWNAMYGRLDRKFKYLKQPGILELLRTQAYLNFLPHLTAVDAICQYDCAHIVLLRGKLLYDISVSNQCAYELPTVSATEDYLLANVVEMLSDALYSFWRINVHVLEYINQLIACHDVLLRSQMIQQCVHCYKQ